MGIAYNSKIVTDGLVLCLDAANPKSYPGTGTTWKDLSGNGNHAVLSGTYNFVNNSFHFNDGSQLNGDGRASVNFGSVSTSYPYTIECIFKINRYKYLSSKSNIAAQLFSSGRTTGNFDEAFYMGRNGVSGEVLGAGLAWYDSNGADGPGGGSDQILKNIVYSTSVTIDAPGEVLFYVNGSKTNTSTTPASDLRLDGEWCIANQPLGYNEGVDSNFYIVRVYNRILSDAEISQNFHATKSRYGL